ncbi:hypothetical protein HK405_003716 [Cladochytrium tenue]|nr:hypothetical protein HK405_003716 [Cladochytrium tenue]
MVIVHRPQIGFGAVDSAHTVVRWRSGVVPGRRRVASAATSIARNSSRCIEATTTCNSSRSFFPRPALPPTHTGAARLSSRPQSTSAAAADSEWDDLALNRPLVHRQTNTRVHLVGIHHQSRASLARVRRVIGELRPSVVCLEVTPAGLADFVAKREIVDRVLGPSPGGGGGGGGDVVRKPTLHVSKSVPAHGSGGEGGGSIRLTRTELNQLARIGVSQRDLDAGGGAHLRPNVLDWGLEVGEAVRAARAVPGARVRAIDVGLDTAVSEGAEPHRRDLAAEAAAAAAAGGGELAAARLAADRALVRRVKEAYRLRRPQGAARRVSAFGTLVYRSVHAWMTGGSATLARYWAGAAAARLRGAWAWVTGRAVERGGAEDQLEWMGRLLRDAGSIEDHRRSLELWGIFFPLDRFRIMEIRDACMTERLRELAEVLAAEEARSGDSGGGVGVGGPGGVSMSPVGRHQQQQNDQPPAKVIVAVVGKMHVFGIGRLWEKYVERQTFSFHKTVPRLDDVVDRFPDLEDLLKGRDAAASSPIEAQATERETRPPVVPGGPFLGKSFPSPSESEREPREMTKPSKKKFVYVDI